MSHGFLQHAVFVSIPDGKPFVAAPAQNRKSKEYRHVGLFPDLLQLVGTPVPAFAVGHGFDLLVWRTND